MYRYGYWGGEVAWWVGGDGVSVYNTDGVQPLHGCMVGPLGLGDGLSVSVGHLEHIQVAAHRDQKEEQM